MPYRIINMADDILENTIRQLVVEGTSPLEIVVVEEHPEFPGELVFQVFEGEQSFYTRYRDWISCYSVLSELYNLDAFTERLETDGWTVVHGASATPILADHERWKTELKIDGYDLHPFQQYSLNRAFESDFWFFNWATGAGKSFVSVAGAKELLARDKIDLVIFCTLSASKINQARFFTAAGLDAVVNDGTKPKRRKGYAERHTVYVMNYEKFNFDQPELEELIHGLRVLFIFDETHKLVTGEFDPFTGAPKHNKARLAFEKLFHLAAPGSKVWPMSASVVDGKPLKFRDVFSLGQDNPLGSRQAFEAAYADEVRTYPIKPKGSRRTIELTSYDWNLGRLQNVRHRVGAYTQTARKTDPGIAPYFKGLQTVVEPIQASAEDRVIAAAIIDKAYAAWQREESLAPYYAILRYLCNTPEALLHTDHEVGQEIAKEFGSVLRKMAAGKLVMLNEQLASIRESGDQALVFTHFTTLTLHLIKDLIEVPHVVHFGAGQSAKDSQAAQDEFKANPDITCFFTSDAGSHGLNCQNARYVIQY